MAKWSLHRSALAASLRDAAAWLIALVVGVLPLSAAAHDIPADVRITAFVRPLDHRLELLVRVPLAALIEVDYPRRGPYLDLGRAEETLRGATKLYLTDNIPVYENDAPLPVPRVAQVRVSLATDRSFDSYARARAHMDEPPLPADAELYWNQQWLDVRLDYSIGSDRSAFALSWGVDRFGINVVTDLNVLLPDGTTRAFTFLGDPGLLRLDPRWFEAAQQFLVAGFRYFLQGGDHLVFLLCLALPFWRLEPLRRLPPLGRVRPLALTVTAFSAGLVISQLASVPDAPWFPLLIATLMALSTVYLGLENIVLTAGRRRPNSVTNRRWMLAFGFGLVHGYAYALAVRELLQYAGAHVLAALFAFNSGVALAQVALLLVLLPALGLLWRHVVADWLGIIILSAFATATAWDWMLARGQQLTRFPAPALDETLLANAMTALLAASMLAGGVWLASGRLGRWIKAGQIAPAANLAHGAQASVPASVQASGADSE